MAKTINIQGNKIRLNTGEYISLTDIAKSKNPDNASDIVRNYLRPRPNLEFLEIWEQNHNDNFNPVGYDGITKDVGSNRFSITAKQWIEATNAIGIEAKPGRYGGTYAHKDIATHFAAWFDPGFCFWMIKEFDRLKTEEAIKLGKPWNVRRELAKVNLSLQSDAIQSKLISEKIAGTKQEGLYFASEADLLNKIVFGQSAKQWKAANTDKKGNQRDHASILELAVLANLEALNSKLIEWDCDQEQRFELLQEEATRQTKILSKNSAIKRLSK